MRLVIDANIVLSCLVSGGLAELMFSPHLELAAPELLFDEIRKHKEEIIVKSRLSDAEVELLLTLIEKQVSVFPKYTFEHLMPKAEKLLGKHVKDSPYIALALYLECPLWSYEKRFEKVKGVEIVNSSDVRNMIDKAN
jgi:predicted nucleic acid-binding protein